MGTVAAAGWRVWAAAAVMAMCLAPVQTAAAASASPGATPPADLASILLDPPGPDYVAEPNGMISSSHIGPLDLDALVAEGGGSATVRAEYRREGFTRGYRKAWVQRGTSAVLIERVEEFERDAGATDNLRQAKFGSQLAADFRGFFDTSGLSDGYGARLVASTNLETDVVVFVKGNLLFVVSAGQPGQSSTDIALAQARSQYADAPAETIDQRGGPQAAIWSSPSPLVLAEWIGAVAVLGLAVLVAVLALVRRRPSESRLPVFADPRYRWDGATWQDATTSIPEGAPRSPDGAHWFDGVAWRPVPPSQRRPPQETPYRPRRFNSN